MLIQDAKQYAYLIAKQLCDTWLKRRLNSGKGINSICFTGNNLLSKHSQSHQLKNELGWRGIGPSSKANVTQLLRFAFTRYRALRDLLTSFRSLSQRWPNTCRVQFYQIAAMRL